jgi:flagellar biogenesis protein FliO
MIRPAPTSGVILPAALALLFAAAPSSAEAPLGAPPEAQATTTTAPSTTDADATAPATTPPPAMPPVVDVTTAPPPPPLDPVEVPPAFQAEDAGSFLWSFVKSMLMLGVVLALIYLVLHKGVGRLVMRAQMGRRMRVVERIALDQRRALYLVEVDGQEVLLAGSEGGVVAVDLPRDRPREQPATPATPVARFSTDLGKSGRPPPETGKGTGGGSLVQGAGAKARESAEG